MPRLVSLASAYCVPPRDPPTPTQNKVYFGIGIRIILVKLITGKRSKRLKRSSIVIGWRQVAPCTHVKANRPVHVVAVEPRGTVTVDNHLGSGTQKAQWPALAQVTGVNNMYNSM